MASKINADEFVDREGEGKPTLPQGVVLSGVTTITTAVVDGNEVANTGGISVGIITSSHFAGNLTGDVNAGIVTVTSQTVIGSAVTISSQGIDIGAGVITATSYAGGGGNLTGIGATIMVWEYNPDPYLTGLPLDTGIGITFNQKIKAGSGNITLSIANAGVAGTVVENFGIGSSVTIVGNSLSFTPTSNLTATRDYCVTLPSGVITNMAGDNYVGTAYTFQARAYSYQLWAIGRNYQGALGQNDRTQRSSPVQIPGTTWNEVTMSVDSFLATKSDGTLWGWGAGAAGQLAQNNRTTYSSPVQVGSDTTWATHISGGTAALAVKTDGTLWSWGYNPSGELGQNNTTQYSSPVQVGSDTTWSQTTGLSWRLATKTDGTLWSWGYNTIGVLGQNNLTKYSSPVQIPGTTWSKISTGHKQTAFGIKTDGTLWGWGSATNKILNFTNNNHMSSPVQIPGTTWSSLHQYGEGVAGFKTDGTLWMWGLNDQGQLGQNNTTTYSSPIQIPGTTWSGDALGQPNSMTATKTDGTFWAWGAQFENGQFGQNNITRYSSPVQIPGTTWNNSKIYYGNYTGCDISIGLKEI